MTVRTPSRHSLMGLTRCRKQRPGGAGHKRHLRILLGVERLEERTLLATFSVLNTLDAGSGSLRQAILDANAAANTDSTGDTVADPDRIIFNINALGVQTIQPLSPLPAISEAVVIDGYTQNGATPNTLAVESATGVGQGLNTQLRIELNGARTVDRTIGLTLNSGDSTVRGLIINGFGRQAIQVHSRNNVIVGNFIGTNATGDNIAGNGGGVMMFEGSHDNRIGGTNPEDRNLISGNQIHGIAIQGFFSDATNNRIQGNLIGTDITGKSHLFDPASNAAISIEASASVAGTSIGGLTAAARNVIVGRPGIQLGGNHANGISIHGNYIGTDVTGNQGIGSATTGIDIFAPGSVIGGSQAGAGNLISGNPQRGISINSTNSTIQGNKIGTNAAGTAAIGNGQSLGVALAVEASNNLIGGAQPGEGNLISGNPADAVHVNAVNNTLRGNQIGTDITGTLALPNGGLGIRLNQGSLVGGLDSDDGQTDGVVRAGNIIAFNRGGGIQVVRTGARMLGNSIFSNSALGIDLGGDFVTPNDPDNPNTPQPDPDSDTGANNRQNFPTIDRLNLQPDFVQLTTGLSSTPNRQFRIELFTSPREAGSFSGKQLIAASVVSTDANGMASIAQTIIGNFQNHVFTSTATDLVAGETSEFSKPVPHPGLIVTTTLDVVNGSDGVISLREAIQNANASQFFPGADTITFQIPANDPGHVYYRDNGGPGVDQSRIASTTVADDRELVDADPDWPHSWWSIPVSSALHSFTELTIDGFSQPGSSPASILSGGEFRKPVHRIEISGPASPRINGIETSGSESILVRGLVINRMGNNIVPHANSTIVGNYLGTDPSGTVGLGAGTGIVLTGSNNRVGGTNVADRNLISGNQNTGIALSGSFASAPNNNLIVNNWIGVASDGIKPLGNGGQGITLSTPGAFLGNNRIEENRIAFNAGNGVLLTDGGNGAQGPARGNAILRNEIFSNGQLGIDIAGAGSRIGVNPNDPGDADEGQNRQQNYPVLEEVVPTSSGYTVFGFLPSEPNTDYLIQLFLNRESDASGFGEGSAFIREQVVRTNASGVAEFAIAISSVLLGTQISATATRLEDHDANSATAPLPRDTSEFSRSIPFEVRELLLGQPVDVLLQRGQEVRFRLVVPPASDARLNVTFSDSRFGEVLVQQGSLPGTNSFDDHVVAFEDANFEHVVPGSPAPYFIVLRGTATASDVNQGTVRLLAEPVGMTIQDVSPNSGSNVGSVTTTIVGTGLDADTNFALKFPGVSRAASEVIQLNETTYFVRFDLTGLNPADYNVEVSDSINSFMLIGGFTVTAGLPGQFSARLVAPPVIRPRGESSLIVEYSNVGETDIEAPLVLVTTPNAVVRQHDFRIITSSGHRASGGRSSSVSYSVFPPHQPIPPLKPVAQFLAIGRNGIAGILPPGTTETVEIRFQDDGRLAPDFHESMNISLQVVEPSPQPFSIASIKEQMRPGHVTEEAWDVVFQNFKDAFGTTIQSYVRALRESANQLSRFGYYVNDPELLARMYLLDADGVIPGGTLVQAVDAAAQATSLPLFFQRVFAPTIARRYDLGALGRGWSHVWETRLSSDPESGDVRIRHPLGIRQFILTSDGTYLPASSDQARLTRTDIQFVLNEIDGTRIHFDRDDGRPLSVEDRFGNRVTLEYSQGRLTRLNHSNGDRFTLEYNSAGRLVRLLDHAGQATTYEYDDSQEHLLSVTTSEGKSTYTYQTDPQLSAEHALASWTPLEGVRQNFAYDESGRLRKVDLEDGSQGFTIDYDGIGQVNIIDASDAAHRFAFFHNGKLLLAENPQGRQVQLTYDDSDQLIRIDLPQATSTFFNYDQVGNLESVVKPDGNYLHFTYASRFNDIELLHDERNNAIDYEYNDRGSLTSIERLNGTSAQFASDPNGDLNRSSNRRGDFINYQRNARGKVIRQEHADGRVKTFAYDNKGNLIAATDDSGTTAMVYDGANRLQRIDYPNGRFLRYQYNPHGQRARLEHSDGYAVIYEYDELGQLSKVKDRDGKLLVSYSYDIEGRLKLEEKGNGTSTEYTYSGTDQVLRIVHRAQDGAVQLQFDYTYDALGRKSSMTTGDGVTHYAYDATGQLTSVILANGQTIRYGYDAAGNRLETSLDGVTTSYVVNPMNQYTEIGPRVLEYDPDGNLILDETPRGNSTEYTYDDENRLVGVRRRDSVTKYEYDIFGNRIARIDDGLRTEFLVDPTGLGNVVAEFGPEGVTTHYAHGLALVSLQRSDEGVAFYAFDGTGSTVAVTRSTGAIANRYSYLPFGEPVSRVEAIDNPFEYVGQLGVERDDIGIDYMRARYYSPSDGRFLTEDPIGVAGGVNLYRYAGNDAVNYVDPSGTIVRQVVIAIFGKRTAAGTFISRKGLRSETTDNLLRVPEADAGRRAAQIGENHPNLQLTEVGRQARQQFLGANPKGFVVTDVFTDTLLFDLLGFAIFALVNDYGNESIANAGLGDLACDLIGCDQPDFDLPLPPGVQEDAVDIRQVFSRDPNDIVGPIGFGESHFVVADTPFVYTIRFENLAAATAAAQEVTVTQTLDDDFDFTTFQLIQFGIGGHVIDYPDRSREFSGGFDLGLPDNQLLNVKARINLETGLITWTFTSFDASTREVPTNPLAGFLPPNVISPQGEGSISYLIRPKSNSATGTRIDAEATIVFDDNAAINTPRIFHTLDAQPPTSQVSALPASSPREFTVQWSGTDGNGSGVVRFDVWVSENDGPFAKWQRGVATTSQRFVGTDGITYRFFSTAVDGVGLVEPLKVNAEALTTVSTKSWQNPRLALDVNDDSLVAPLDALIIINRINLIGPGPLPPPDDSFLPPPYFDTSGDNFASAIDVLLVINHLNLNSGSGEGQADSPDSASLPNGPDRETELRPDLVDSLLGSWDDQFELDFLSHGRRRLRLAFGKA